MQKTLSKSDYSFIRELVYEHSRINLGEHKTELVFARIGKRMRANGIQSASEYCELLRADTRKEELAHLIDVISTNHTHFFREYGHFEFLEQTILPSWQSAQAHKPQRFNIWSAASSSGEEPYSLAMAIDRWEKRHNQTLDWKILATDISNRMLDRARDASYNAAAVEPIRKDWQRYFDTIHGPKGDHFRVKDAMRKKVSFFQVNLLGARIPKDAIFDLIFCRNVMIYFDRETQDEILRRLGQALKPGAYLIVGHSESLGGLDHRLRMIRPSIYQKAS